LAFLAVKEITRKVFVAIYRSLFSQGMSKRDREKEEEQEIGKIKFMNIDYSRLGHAGHVGSAAACRNREEKKISRTNLIQSR
jgi:hypothetical protein